MKKYKVKSGENIFDISLYLFGAIDGIWDLLVCNPDLSIETVLKSGNELYYHEDFIINDSVSKYLKDKKADVKNGHHCISSRNVESSMSSIMESFSDNVKRRLRIIDEIGKVADNVVNSIFERGDMFEESLKECAENELPAYNGSVLRVRSRGAAVPVPPIDAEPISILESGELKTAVGSAVGDKVMIDVDFTKTIDKEINIFGTLGGEKTVDVETAVNDFSGSQVTFIQAEDADDYFENAVKPKFVVKQHGRYSKISVQMASGGLFLVDWGDGSDYSYATYSSSEILLDHNYSDGSYHTITVYGIMNIEVLDLTDVAGVYYFIIPIAVNKEFRSKISDKQLNKFIYVKQNEQVD